MQTVGLWVKTAGKADVNAAQQFYLQHSTVDLPVVKLGFTGVQLLRAIEVPGLEPKRPNPFSLRPKGVLT